MSQFKLADYRLLSNIEQIEDALEILEKIHGHKFEWNESKQSEYEGVDFGFVAQEIMGAIPKSVKKENKQLYVDATALIPFLVQGIHELVERNEYLKKDVEQLKYDVESMKTFFKIDKEEI